MQIRAESKALPETVASSLQQPQTEADIWGPMQGTRRILLLGLSLLAAASFGWLASAWVAPQTSARGSRVVVDKDVEDLLDTLRVNGDLPKPERKQLIERLLALGRLQEAQLVVQPLWDEQPRPVSLALLMADLRRLNGDPDGARADLNQLLQLKPDLPKALELMVLLDWQEGRQVEAAQALQKRFEAKERGQRLEIGLLLADLQRQQGDPGAAATLYRQLAEEVPGDARSLLALALLRQEEGHAEEVQALLHQAKLRRVGPGKTDPLIDGLAASWGLTAARIKASKSLRVPAEKT